MSEWSTDTRDLVADEPALCPICGGKGFMEEFDPAVEAFLAFPCAYCHGTGEDL